MTLEAVANQVGVSVRTIERWEESDTEPSVEQFYALAACLAMVVEVRPIDPDELLGEGAGEAASGSGAE